MTDRAAWHAPYDDPHSSLSQRLGVVRRAVVGAELAPGETWNLALTLGREERPGTFADVKVRCTVDGDASRHRLAHALTVVPAGPCPSEPRT